MRTLARAAAVTVFALWLGGVSACAGIKAHEKAQQARAETVQRFIAEQQLESLTREFFGRKPMWSLIDAQHLVLWKSRREPILVTLDAPCRSLRDALAIEFGRFGNLHSLRPGLDALYPVLRELGAEHPNREQATNRPRCNIASFHRIDSPQVAELQAAVEAQSSPPSPSR